MTDYMHFDGGDGSHVTASGYLGVAGEGSEQFDPRTVAFWIRTATQSGTANSVVYWGDGFTTTAEPEFQNRIRFNNGGRMQLFGNTSYIETLSGVADGTWHHVAFVYAGGGHSEGPLGRDRGGLRVSNFADADVYLDGELNNGRWKEDGVTDVQTSGQQDVVIGARVKTAGVLTDFFEGDLDEVAIWRHALPPTVISGVYDGGVRGSVDLSSLPFNHTLELWYSFDEPGDTAPNGSVANLTPGFPFPGSGITGSGTSIIT